MRKIAGTTLLVLHFLVGNAQWPGDQKAGEMSYALVNATNPNGSPNIYYHFTLKMVVACDYGAPGVNPFFINDFDYPSQPSIQMTWVYDSASNKVNMVDPCIAFPSPPCYRTYYFHRDTALPFNHGGFAVLYPDCCRDYYQNISTEFNASQFEGSQLGIVWAPGGGHPGEGYVYNGIMYIMNIPNRYSFLYNSSPVFNSSSDTVLYVCQNTSFSHVFGATDPDNDSLTYSFLGAKTFFAKPAGPGVVTIQTTGNTKDVSYINPPYSATQPAGAGVTIDPLTGLVQGQLQDTGSYLITVAVNEYRKGVLISPTPHTRDVVLKVFDCSKLPTPKAVIPPLINNCNSYTVTLPNSSTPYDPSLYWDNTIYLWNLGDGSTSLLRYPVHTYDTGTYNIRLITMPGYRCADTAYTKLLVYPSLKASFTSVGSCTGTPVQFTNTSAADIGEISNLTWTFTNTSDSTSFTTLVNNPAHVFPSPNQTYMVALDAVTTKGCEAKDTQYINIWQSPYPLSPHDTVLTAGEPYQLHANAGYDSLGSFTWSPAIGLNNPYSANPIATGTEDITYRVQMDNSHGCTLSDTEHIVYYKGPDIYLPDAFTPNGDGHNDVFRPFPVGISHLEYFRVFDRWGRIVYQTQSYLAGWDGTLKGVPAPPGTYVWEVRGLDYNGKMVFKRGTVLLVR